MDTQHWFPRTSRRTKENRLESDLNTTACHHISLPPFCLVVCLSLLFFTARVRNNFRIGVPVTYSGIGVTNDSKKGLCLLLVRTSGSLMLAACTGNALHPTTVLWVMLSRLPHTCSHLRVMALSSAHPHIGPQETASTARHWVFFDTRLITNQSFAKTPSRSHGAHA